MKTVLNALRASANRDRVLVERLAADGTPARMWTYGRMLAWAGELDRMLRDRGLPPGTPIGVVAGNSPEWVAADLALLLGGFSEVPVPLAFSAEQAKSLLHRVRVCLADAAGAARLKAWGLSGSVESIVVVEPPRDARPPEPAARRPTGSSR